MSDKKRLIYAILKFLDEEIRGETNNAERRESMEGMFFIFSIYEVTQYLFESLYII